jgi:hypothetical protein
MPIHCVAHNIDMVMKTLSTKSLVDKIEKLLAKVYSYFFQSNKKVIDLERFIALLDVKGLKIFQVVKTSQLSMFSPTKKALTKYKPFIM